MDRTRGQFVEYSLSTTFLNSLNFLNLLIFPFNWVAMEISVIRLEQLLLFIVFSLFRGNAFFHILYVGVG